MHFQFLEFLVDLPLQSGFRDVNALDFDLPYTCDIVTSRENIGDFWGATRDMARANP